MSNKITRQAIKNSFMKFLNDRPLDRVYVTDIVEDCGINRNTFYYHYDNVIDLLEEIFEEETRTVLEQHNIFSSWEDGILHSIQFAMENKKAIFHIYNSAQRENVERYLYQIVEKIMISYVTEQAKGLKASEEDIKYIALFYKHAIVGIFLEWLQRGMKDDPNMVIMKMADIFEGQIKVLLEKADKKNK